MFRLLFSVQARNFCLNLTTSERFSGKPKAVQESRTSSYLSQSAASEAMSESLMGESILEAMGTRDHSGASCPCLMNCTDMWCLSYQPDQLKIYSIQHGKTNPEDTEGEPLFERPRGSLSRLGNKGSTPSRHSLTGAPKKRHTSTVNPESVNTSNELDIMEDFGAT